MYLAVETLVSYISIPPRVSAAFPTLPPHFKHPLFAFIACLLAVEWVIALKILARNNGDALNYTVVLTNAAAYPSLVYLLYLFIYTSNPQDPRHYPKLTDFVILYLSSTFSMQYHFCDAAAWNPTDSPELYEYCETEGRYNHLQQYDFGFAFFMIAMGFLYVADVRPFSIRVLLYALGTYYALWSMNDDNRWDGGDMLFFTRVLFPSVLLFFGRHFYDAYRLGGERVLLKLAAMKRLALAFAVLGAGFACKFQEDDTERNTYLRPHSGWHVGAFGGIGVLFWFGVEHRRRIDEVLDKERLGDVRGDDIRRSSEELTLNSVL